MVDCFATDSPKPPRVTVVVVAGFGAIGLHAALTKLTGSEIVSTEIAVSRTQLLTVQCADETRYYRDGQQEDVVTQEQGVFEKG